MSRDWSHLAVLGAASEGSRDFMRAVLGALRCVTHGYDLLPEQRILIEAYAMTSGDGWPGHVALAAAGFDEDPTVALGDAAGALIGVLDEIARRSPDGADGDRWALMSRLSVTRDRRIVHRRLARDGFHRVGRLDDAGRRSIWLREEVGGDLEIAAGREGGDEVLRVARDHPMHGAIYGVMSCARFAAEWEDQRGRGLDRSYGMDRHPRSIHGTACSLGVARSCAGCGRPFCCDCCLPCDVEPGKIQFQFGDGGDLGWFCDDDACVERECGETGESPDEVSERHIARRVRHP